MELGLKGKVVVVTGGGRGIGKTIALEFAKEGSHIAVCGRTPETLEATAKEATTMGVRTLAVRTDITKEAEVVSFMERVVTEFGHVDILVNNAAGSEGTMPIESVTVEKWNSAFDTTLLGAVLCCREAVKSMLPRKEGVIINISSIRGKIGHPQMLPYASAKAGLESFTRSLAQGLGRSGIRVNAVVVGAVSNQQEDPKIIQRLTARAALQGKTLDQYIQEKLRDVPIGRLVESQEVADLTLFLASARSGAITGQSINCDGGRVQW